jgi:hypothetical protein
MKILLNGIHSSNSSTGEEYVVEKNEITFHQQKHVI